MYRILLFWNESPFRMKMTTTVVRGLTRQKKTESRNYYRVKIDSEAWNVQLEIPLRSWLMKKRRQFVETGRLKIPVYAAKNNTNYFNSQAQY